MALRVLVTGGNGFLGAYVSRELLKRGHAVTVCIRASSDLSRLKRLTEGGQQKLQTIQYDDIDFGAGYDVIVHMATAYGRNKEKASDIIAGNILMPAKLIEQCLVHGISTFINTDTYYAAAGVSHNMAAYILSKQHFNKWSKLIAETNLKLVNMRIEHLYGPMDAHNKFCTAIVRDCLIDKPRISLTEGDQLRDFIYVEDAASAYATVLDNIEDCPDGWSEVGVGSGHATPLREYVILAHTLTGSRSVLGFGDITKTVGEIPASKADNTFLTDRGWSCKVQLIEGIKAVIEDVEKSVFPA